MSVIAALSYLEGSKEPKLFDYFAYGLGIRSALPIAEFVPADVGCDVTITIDEERSLFDCVPQEVVEQPLALQLEGESALVYVKEAGAFLVRGGREMALVPAPDADESKLRLALVGTVMAILLQQRGALVLHASAVNIEGNAILFLGNSGEGKSSMAAALQARGYAVIADDVAAVSWEEGRATLAPGFPQIKLSREVAEVLGYDWDSLRLLHPRLDKRGLRLAQDFPQKSLPIGRIYVLASGSDVRFSPLKKQSGVMELMRHSELMKLLGSGEARHLQRCSKLAEACGVYCLRRPRHLTLLPELAKIVEENVGCERKLDVQRMFC